MITGASATPRNPVTPVTVPPSQAPSSAARGAQPSDPVDSVTSAAPDATNLIQAARKGIGGLFVPGGHDRISIHLEDPEYQNVGNLEGARMIGYFTQQLQSQGFPWRVYECRVEGDEARKVGDLSELDALAKLQKGEPVLFQPMRNLQLDLSSQSLGALAAAGQLTGRSDLTGVSKVADFTKNTQVTPGSQGFTLKHGAPVVVSNLGQLKLLYQMYNPEVEISEKNAIGKSAHQLSYFTKETMTSAYPWRFYKPDDGNRIVRVLKAAIPGAFGGGLVGAGIGALVGLPIGLFTGNWTVMKTLATYGAMGGSVYKGLDSARTATKGVSVNAVEGLERVLEGKPVVFQQTQMRSVGVPVVGKISWFSDYGKGSTISDTPSLDTFYYMQNQGAKLPTDQKKPEPKPEKPAQAPIVIINEIQVHNEHHSSNPIVVVDNGR